MLERLRGLVTGHPARLGLVGAILILVGGSWYQALITPPYRFADEQAHAGYVLAVQDGHLPSIDTPIDEARGGVALRTRLASEPERRRDVWVANNPPLAYLLAAGPAAITRALGLPGGPLLGLRLVNVAAAAGAVALAYAIGRDLAGGDRTVGLVTAGLVAAMPHLGFVAALGFTDGLALLATTGVTWALARVAGAGATPTDGRAAVRSLGLWCALAAAMRPMALVFALVAGLLGLGVVWWRRSRPLGWTIAWLALPTLVTSAWFYALNVHRYGDPTGSDAIFEKFGRQAAGSLWSVLTLRGLWERVLRTIITRRLEAPLPGDSYLWYQIAAAVVVLGVLGTTVLVVRAAAAQRRNAAVEQGGPAALPVAAWVVTAALAAVPWVLSAQHRAGGGALHPRYLFPMVPVIAAAVALTAVRLAGRWAGALVVALVAVAFSQTRAAARWLAATPSGPPGSELVTAYGNELIRGAGLAVAAAGLVLLVASLVITNDADGTNGSEGTGPPAPTT